MKKEVIQSIVLTEHYIFDTQDELKAWCTANMNKSPWMLGANNDLFIELEEHEDEEGRGYVYEVIYTINGHEQFRLSGDKENIQRVASYIIVSIGDMGYDYEVTQEPNLVHINELCRNEGAGGNEEYMKYFDFDKPFKKY